MATNAPETTGIAAERQLHCLIKDLCVDERVLNYVLFKGKPHFYETALWDYKRELPNVSGYGQKDDDLDFKIAELIKDVLAFYNSYGGYIVVGIDQHRSDPFVGCNGINSRGFTVEKLNSRVKGYTGVAIDCRFMLHNLTFSGKNCEVGLLFIPMRPAALPVARFRKGSPEKNGKQVFAKDAIYARIDDNCLPVHADLAGLQFVVSSRDYGSSLSDRISLEHNVPHQDPNLIRFIGRAGYLLDLWQWLTEPGSPLKILTALGGTGKTAIAYEFARQVVDSSPSNLAKVIWLSAKKRTYSATDQMFIPMSRTDFTSIGDFFKALASEVGCMQQEIDEQMGDTHLLNELCLLGLRQFPSLIVIDDIDSLNIDEQAELFNQVQLMAARAYETGTRVLITSRLEFGAASQRIEVAGFSITEFLEYAEVIAMQLGVKLDAKAATAIHKASLGSPLFGASILRLMRIGTDVYKAIDQWRNVEGEEVRHFAFERELDQLSDTEARILYALSILGESTQAELKNVLEISDIRLTTGLARLRQYHLYATRGSVLNLARLQVPEPIRLMSATIASRLSSPRLIEKECQRVRKTTRILTDRVAIAIGTIVSLWKEEEYEGALESALAAVAANPAAADLHSILGACYLKLKNPDLAAADNAFKEARRRGCERPELVPDWLRVKELLADWIGIVDIVNTLSPHEVRAQVAVYNSMAHLLLGREAVDRSDYKKARDRYHSAMRTASNAIAQGRAGDQLSQLREICRNAARLYTHFVDRMSTQASDRLDLYDATIEAFECHVTEAQMLIRGLQALQDWADSVNSRKSVDIEAVSIFRRRIEKAQEVWHHIITSPNPRIDLSERLREYIARFIAQSDKLRMKAELSSSGRPIG